MQGVTRTTTEYSHVPVMADVVVDMLSPSPGEVCLDVTLGLGGHAERLMPRLRGGAYIGLDRDRQGIARASERLRPLSGNCRLHAVAASYADAAFALKRAGFSVVDLVLADLGVSSYQLDAPERGFSFRYPDAKLDLRMDEGSGLSAADRLAAADEGEIARVLRDYGDVGQARQIAARLAANPPQTTGDLVRLVGVGNRGKFANKLLAKIFQAIRIWVNDELGQLAELLKQIPTFVKSGARVVFMSYHSLEDRLVKQAFREWEGQCNCPADQPVCNCNPIHLGSRIVRRAVRPSEAEIAENPRARSAVLRGFKFFEAPHV